MRMRFGCGSGAVRMQTSTSSKPTTEFAQPRLSRVKGRSSPARGCKFGCVCSYMAGHYPDILMTGHLGTNTPKFVPPRWGRPSFDPTYSNGAVQIRLWVWSSLRFRCGSDAVRMRFGRGSDMFSDLVPTVCRS